jgi:hypothetical protein
MSPFLFSADGGPLTGNVYFLQLRTCNCSTHTPQRQEGREILPASFLEKRMISAHDKLSFKRSLFNEDREQIDIGRSISNTEFTEETV